VVGVVPSSENTINGRATKPGDVIRTRAGKTVEVINTDAEGRLILADALHYAAERFSPAGHGGLRHPHRGLRHRAGAPRLGASRHRRGADRQALREAGDRSGERCWPLPLWEAYRKQLESPVADLKNVGGRPAGTITRRSSCGSSWATRRGRTWTSRERPTEIRAALAAEGRLRRPDPSPPGVGPDTIPAEQQVLPRNVPSGGVPMPTGVERGVWEWDRTALLNHPALTLHDLLSFVPGVTMVRGGDIGSPVGVTWGGLGGGQVRVFLDGVEDAPLESGIVDFAQLGLTGIERVRIERGVAEIRVHLTSHRFEDGRPLTVLEVGTGDLRTNLFRAGFAHPDALGGTILVALDRLDTDGPGREEPGAIFGTRLRYTLFPTEGTGIALEYRTRTARRPEGLWEPREVSRSELSARAGWTLTESVTAEFHAVRSTASLGERSEPEADSLLPEEARTSLGGRVSWDAGALHAWAGGSVQGGLGWPASRMETGITAAFEPLGGVSARWDRETWSDLARTGRDSDLPAAGGGAAGGWSIHGWTAPRLGVSLFAEAEHARRGFPFVVPGPRAPEPEGEGNGEEPGEEEPGNGAEEELEPVPFDPVRFFDRSGVRAGARVAWRGADLSAAWVRVEADSLPSFGLPFDRDEPAAPGGVRTGVEVQGRIPLNFLLGGLSVAGTGQFWDADEAWRAPFTQSWFGRLQFRVVTVRVFVHWENFVFKEDNADLPEDSFRRPA
jgi:hypothetical protein